MVSNRHTAAQVVTHFREHRVGTVNCKITAELSKFDRYATIAIWVQMACLFLKDQDLLDLSFNGLSWLLTATVCLGLDRPCL